MPKTIQIIVRGKVQGVYFRESSKKKALELGLNGTVQNRADGSVEINVTGNDAELDLFVEWCKIGPPAASVDELQVKNNDQQKFDSFRVIRG